MKNSLFTASQIAQALMVNYQTDLASNIDRERHPSHVTLQQLFILRGETRRSRLHMVYLGKTGELQQYDLAPMRIHNPVSNVPAYRNRLQYIQVSMNNKTRVNDDMRRVVPNSAPFKFDELMSNSKIGDDGKTYNNPYNTAFVNGIMRLAPVPAVHADAATIKAFNECSAEIRLVHARLKESAEAKGLDLSTNASYRKAMEKLYPIYLERMTALINNGTLALAQVLSVSDSGMVTAFTCDSEMETANPYFNAKKQLQESISYMPVVNEVFGYARIDSDAKADILNPDLSTGLRDLGRNEETADGAVSTSSKRKEATRLAYISDSFGNESSLLLRRQDNGYVNPNNTNQSGQAEIFFNVTQNNDSVFFRGKYLPLVITKDVGGASNGILRGTVVIDEFTRHRDVSLVASVESSTSVFEELDLDNVDEYLSQGVDFTSEAAATETAQVDAIPSDFPSDVIEDQKELNEAKAAANKMSIL